MSDWLALGTHEQLPDGVGDKGRLLSEARRAGLAVPEGVLVLDGAHPIGLPLLAPRVAVRSAFSAEDRAHASLAGFFTTHLNVDGRDAEAIASSVNDVRASAGRLDGGAAVRRDVLIMSMVDAVVSGVAFTEADFEDDRINYTTGTAEALVSGVEPGQALELPKLRRLDGRIDAALRAPWTHRLQCLLRDVRRVFGERDWDVEWADDGARCWLLQVRPITRPILRDETWTRANLKEILPDLPSHLVTDVMAYCSDKLFAYYRAFDPTLPRHRPLVTIVEGRPVFNGSLLSDMMRHFGLPTRLVTSSIGGSIDRDHPYNFRRCCAKTRVLLKLGYAQLVAVGSARRTIELLQQRSEHPGDTLGECVRLLAWMFVTLITEMFSLTSAMSGPLFVLRAARTLAEHNARQETVSTAFYAELAPLRRLAEADPEIARALAAGQLPDDPSFQAAWTAWLARHGHRGIYESDVSRPRFHEAPEGVLPSIVAPEHEAELPPRTLRGWLTLPMWWQASRAMRARELLRYESMRGFDRIRRRLLELADEAVARGQLPDRDAIFQLDIDEIERIDTRWAPAAAFWEERRALRERWAAVQLPIVFKQSDRFDAAAASDEHQDLLHGTSLTTGVREGRAWVLHEPAATLPDGFDPTSTVLVAYSIDIGWIPTLGQVCGAVVEIGGDLSHGSIIVREIGLPAVTNVPAATRAVRTGDRVRLDAGAGTVRVVTRHAEPIEGGVA